MSGNDPFPWRGQRPAIRERAVIEVEYLYGDGTPDSPHRRVVAYFDPSGTLLAERDEWEMYAVTGTSNGRANQ